MDWNKHETYEHLNVMEVQTKLNEINNENKKNIIVCKYPELNMNLKYNIEIWYHFKSQNQITIVYMDNSSI